MAINDTLGLVALGENEHKLIITTGISATTSMGTADVSYVINPDSINTTVAIGTPILETDIQITATGIASTTQLGTPSLLDDTVSWITPITFLDNVDWDELDSVSVQFEAESIAPSLNVIHYKVVKGDLPGGLILNVDTGLLSGDIVDMDTYWQESDPEVNWYVPDYNVVDVGSVNSGALWEIVDGVRVSTEQDHSFTIRAMEDPNLTYDFENPPYTYEDREFTVGVGNNWDIDAKNLILNLDTQFYIDGEPVTNQEYFDDLQDQGYWPSV